jgi:hypothetical protein
VAFDDAPAGGQPGVRGGTARAGAHAIAANVEGARRDTGIARLIQLAPNANVPVTLDR